MTQNPLPDLLGPGDKPWLNACVNYSNGNWSFYSRGYRRAAEVLTNHVVEKGIDQDPLIIPVLFLWRHHVELELKALGRSASGLLGRSWSPPGQHDLAQLFGEVRTLIGAAFDLVGEKLPQSDMERLRSVLKHFRGIDEQSAVFRYPESLRGAESLPGVTHINYEKVTSYFESLADLLGGASWAIGVLRDTRSGWLSEQQP